MAIASLEQNAENISTDKVSILLIKCHELVKMSQICI